MTTGASLHTFTYKRVKEYFASHLCASQKEAAHDLGLSISCIRANVRLIRGDWHNQSNPILDLTELDRRLCNLEKVMNVLD